MNLKKAVRLEIGLMLLAVLVWGCGGNMTDSKKNEGTPEIGKETQQYLYDGAVQRIRKSYERPEIDTYLFAGKLIDLYDSSYYTRLTFDPIEDCKFSRVNKETYLIKGNYQANGVENIFEWKVTFIGDCNDVNIFLQARETDTRYPQPIWEDMVAPANPDEVRRELLRDM